MYNKKRYLIDRKSNNIKTIMMQAYRDQPSASYFVTKID